MDTVYNEDGSGPPEDNDRETWGRPHGGRLIHWYEQGARKGLRFLAVCGATCLMRWRHPRPSHGKRICPKCAYLVGDAGENDAGPTARELGISMMPRDRA